MKSFTYGENKLSGFIFQLNVIIILLCLQTLMLSTNLRPYLSNIKIILNYSKIGHVIKIFHTTQK